MPLLWLLVVTLPRRAVARVVRLWCRRVLPLSGCPLQVAGLERVPASGRVVLAANHASYLDAVVLLAAIPRPFRFVAKRELAAWPLVGAVLRRAGHLTVDRTDLAHSVADVHRVRAQVAAGDTLCFFPEGTFRAGRGLLPFRLGAFRIAADTGAVVVPVTIRGTREVLPAGAWLPRPRPITVEIGAPIAPGGHRWRDIVALRDRVRATMAAE